MTDHHEIAQLKQLLKDGYTTEEIHRLTQAPEQALAQAQREYQQLREEKAQRAVQHQQAAYAMKFSGGRA